MPPTVDLSRLLATLELTRDLDAATRQELVARSLLHELPAGQRLHPAAFAGERWFLIDGSAVRMSQATGHRLQCCQRLSDPLEVFGDSPAAEDVLVAEAPCLFLRLPHAALEAALATRMEVEDIELDATEGDFLGELYETISSKQLELPARPEIALQIQDLTTDPESGLAELTELIQRDGTLAGALVSATNSPMFRGAKQILSVRDAVVRLGFHNTRIITMNLALRRAFKARYDVTRQAMQEVWSEGVLIAAYAYLLSDTLKLLHRERALLAGLIAGVGAVPIIQFVEMRDPTPQRERVDALVRKLQAITGVLVINYWGLGEDLVKVAEQAHNWNYRAAEPDYASVAIVGRWAALQSEQRADRPPAAEVPAFAILGLSEPDNGGELTELSDRGQRLDQLKKMFNA